MDFRLDDDQLALQEAVRRFCAARFPLESVTAREGAPIDRAAWRAMGQMGMFGVMAPEAEGGSGLGPVEAAIILEQVGIHLAPVAALWSILSAAFFPDVASGERIVSGVDATALGDEPILVEHAGDLDTLIILREDGLFACQSGNLPAPVPVAPLDPLTPIGCYPALGDGVPIAATADMVRIRQLGAVLAAAMLVGVSAAALETARTYALERRQFGVPIGSFQAVKHLLADMYVRTSLARSAAFAAAALCRDADPDEAVMAASGAKVLAGEAAIGNGRIAVQVLGGMGYTWAMLPHYLLKRAWVLEHAFGTAAEHAAAMGSRIGADVG